MTHAKPPIFLLRVVAPSAGGFWRIERGLVQGPANSDRLAFVHRDRIQHERRGDRLVGAIAGQITPQAISGGLVIVYDVSVVEYLHSQGKELCTFGTPGIVQVSDDRELIAFGLAARVIGFV